MAAPICGGITMMHQERVLEEAEVDLEVVEIGKEEVRDSMMGLQVEEAAERETSTKEGSTTKE